MARHALTEPRVQQVIQQVADLVLATGTVQAALTHLQAALDRQNNPGRLYPNRLHTLLDGDPERSVNTNTLELLEEALAHAEALAITSTLPTTIQGRAAHLGDSITTRRALAKQLRVPLSVIHRALNTPEVTTITRTPVITPNPTLRAARQPDWSYQDDAVRNALDELRQNPPRRTALVIPTAGGKTRIAMRIALHILQQHPDPNSTVIWVTHRRNLLRQARRELRRALNDPTAGWPQGALEWLHTRVILTLTRPLPDVLQAHRDHLALIVVDEAHHAAAPSYEAIFEESTPALFLTATPNRADGLPLNVDSIAYSTSYRDLFERGTVIEPIFDDAPFDRFQWTPRLTTVTPHLDESTPGTTTGRTVETDDVTDLADYLLERTCTDLSKVLVAVSRVEHTERLYEALQDVLPNHPHHPLASNDIMFVHAGSSSTGASPDDALEVFRGQTGGILVATGQLIGEGFDDPGIDGVVITYPSTSMSHLMQLAGRALRYAEGKTKAHIIQIHQSPLEYHFEHRWLYQDITDHLRPQLLDRTVNTVQEAHTFLESLLNERGAAPATVARVLSALAEHPTSASFQVMLSGLPYYGPREAFTTDATWAAFPVTSAIRTPFIALFNHFSYAAHDAKAGDELALVGRYFADQPVGPAERTALTSMLSAMVEAAKERQGTPGTGHDSRPPVDAKGTTWLTYVTITFQNAIPEDLQDFLHDARNAEDIRQHYLTDPTHWAAAVKVPLPIDGTWAYLLSSHERDWMEQQRTVLAALLTAAAPREHFQILAAWRAGLTGTPVATLLTHRPDVWLTERQRQVFWLTLQLPSPESAH